MCVLTFECTSLVKLNKHSPDRAVIFIAKVARQFKSNSRSRICEIALDNSLFDLPCYFANRLMD